MPGSAPDPTASDRGDRRRSGRQARVGALLTALALVALGGCMAVPTAYRGPEGAPTVLIHGDSLTYQSERGITGLPSDAEESLLTDLLVTNGHRAAVWAAAGDTAAKGRNILAAWPDVGLEVPDVVVLALGSNDLMLVQEGEEVADGAVPPHTLSDALLELDAYLTELDALGVGCIAVLAVATPPGDWHLDRYGMAWNGFLRGHGLVDHVQPWDEVAAAHPEIYTIEGDIHFDPDLGGPLYRQELLAAADACVDR